MSRLHLLLLAVLFCAACSKDPFKTEDLSGVVLDTGLLGKTEDEIRALFPNLKKKPRDWFPKDCPAGEECNFSEELNTVGPGVKERRWFFDKKHRLWRVVSTLGATRSKLGGKAFSEKLELYERAREALSEKHGEPKCDGDDTSMFGRTCEWLLPNKQRIWMTGISSNDDDQSLSFEFSQR